LRDTASQNKEWLRLRYGASETRVAEVFSRLETLGVGALLIKGLAVARYYPDPSTRFFSDIDICIPENARNNQREVVAGLSGLGVDLHLGFKTLDEIPWEIVRQRADRFEVAGVTVNAPRREDHFRILATHWLNDGGRRVDKLLDLYHCATSSPEGFDWSLCIGDLTPERRNWVAKGIGALKEFMDLEIPGNPFTPEELHLPSWFVDTVRREARREGIKPLAFADSLKGVLRELKSKFPPNPIQSAIEAGVPLEDGIPRVAQLRSLFARTGYFLKFFVLRMR